MTWSYDSTGFAANRDKVRFYIGDTSSSAQILTNEEINFALDEEGGVVPAAALCCESIAAEFGRLADKSVGSLSISLSQKYDQYSKKAEQLRRKGWALALPYVGGVSIDRMDTVESDTDLVEPAFKIGMLDNPDGPVSTRST